MQKIVFKLILAWWHSFPIKTKHFENQPIGANFVNAIVILEKRYCKCIIISLEG